MDKLSTDSSKVDEGAANDNDLAIDSKIKSSFTHTKTTLPQGLWSKIDEGLSSSVQSDQVDVDMDQQIAGAFNEQSVGKAPDRV